MKRIGTGEPDLVFASGGDGQGSSPAYRKVFGDLCARTTSPIEVDRRICSLDHWLTFKRSAFEVFSGETRFPGFAFQILGSNGLQRRTGQRRSGRIQNRGVSESFSNSIQ